MGKASFVVFFLAPLVFSLSFGQPIITEDHLPKAGDRWSYKISLEDIDPGNEGADQFWDFSDLSFSSSTFTLSSEPAEDVQWINELKNAELFFETSNNGNISFVHLEGNSLIEDGYIIFFDDDLYTYGDRRKRLIFPFAFGDSFQDTYNASSAQANVHDGHVTIVEGSVWVHADAYGQLLLPGEDTLDVLRLTSTDVRHDSTNILPHPNGLDIIYDDSITTFSFFTAEYRWPVMEVRLTHRITNYTFLTTSTEIFYYPTLDNPLVGIPPPFSFLQVQWKQEGDFLLFEFPHHEHVLQGVLTNSKGQNVLQSTWSKGENVKFPTRDLNRGIYFAQFLVGNRNVNAKVFVP